MDGFFEISKRGSDVHTEVHAGVVAFMGLIYVLAVIPQLMSYAGGDWSCMFTSSVLAIGISSILMGLYTKYPMVISPGLGLCVYISYIVILTMGYTWSQALLASAISCILAMFITFSGYREKVVNVIPQGLQRGITACLGISIMALSLIESGIVVCDGTTLSNGVAMIGLGNIKNITVALSLLALIISVVLYSSHFKQGSFIAVLITGTLGVIYGIIEPAETFVAMPSFDFVGKFVGGLANMEISLTYITTILVITFISIQENGYSMPVVAGSTAMSREKYDQEKEEIASAVNVCSLVGVAFGSTQPTVSLESLHGTRRGGKTGMVPIIAGLLVLMTIFFAPMFKVISAPCCTVGCLMILGVTMLTSLKSIKWSDMAASIPISLMLIFSALTLSIGNALCIGVIAYVIVMLFEGRMKEMGRFIWLLAALCTMYVVSLGYGW